MMVLQSLYTDRDARWTKKHGKSFYGYKVHSNVDARWKLIRRIQVTAANVDDGHTLQAVVDIANTRGRLLADRDYDAQATRGLLAKHPLRDGIARRAKPGQEARQRLDARNRAINKTRARVEHVFAGLEQLGGKVVRAMTLARNAHLEQLRHATLVGQIEPQCYVAVYFMMPVNSMPQHEP